MVNAATRAPTQNACTLAHNNKDRWMKRSLTALALVIAAAAGGLTQRGTERGIKVHRRDASGQVQVLQPDINDKLQANDVVYIKESLF